MLEITCPHCQLSKQVDPAQLPETAVRATCPRCKQSFELPQRPTEESAKTVESEAVSNADPQPQTQAPAAPQQTEIAAIAKAGFWIRVVATLLDGLVVFVLQFGLG